MHRPVEPSSDLAHATDSPSLGTSPEEIEYQCPRCELRLEVYAPVCPQCGEALDSTYSASYRPPTPPWARKIALAALLAMLLLVVLVLGALLLPPAQ